MNKFLTFLFVLFSALILRAEVFFVTTSGNETNNGKTWSSAFADIQKAIDTASSVASEGNPSQVWIASGTYTVSSVKMKNNVEIYGGFTGTEEKLEDRTSGNETILTTTGYYVINNRYTEESPLTSSSKLDGVTIKGASGYGIYNYYASPTVMNCTITENDDTGICNYSSNPTITNCTITENYNNGIYNDDSSPTITNCTIAANGTIGIYNVESSNPTITNCTITGNSFSGIINNSSNPTITNCTIAENYYGIDNRDSSSPTITNCTITENDDGICNSFSSPTITNCIIWGNTRDEIDNNSSSSSPIITYCVVEGGYTNGTNIITKDPLLGELGNYGGFVQTIPAVGSAIKAGTTGDGIPTTDARGVQRANPPAIGAFEPSTTDITHVALDIPNCVVLGKDAKITMCNDGVVDEYILYCDDKIIYQGSSNEYTITPTSIGEHKYYVIAKYGDSEIKSAEKIVYHLKDYILYVSANGNDDNMGDSWEESYATLTKALDVASKFATDENPIQIWIAKGTYYNAGGTYNSSTNKNTAFVMKNNVEIYGGFAGTEEKLEDRTSGNETILTTTGSYVIYNYCTSSKPLTSSARLDSVTIKGASRYGIYNNYASPTVMNCTIAQNSSCGIYNTSSNPTITNCTITENSSYSIYNNDSSPTITNCTITDNGVYGIYNYNSSNPTITNCTITENGTYGIYNYYASPTITNCTIAQNYYGIDNSSSSPTITNCTITGNSYAIYNTAKSSITIINSILWGDKYNEIYNVDTTNETSVTASNCVIEGGFEGGTNIITKDPILGEIGDYGGSVNTIPVATNGSAALAGVSGDGIPTTDARGVVRSNSPTIGAFENVTNGKPTYSFCDIKNAMSVGNKYQVTVYADGNPSDYVLYKNGVEYKRQKSNTFTITPTQSEFNDFSWGVVYNDEVIKNEKEVNVRYLTGNVLYVSPSGNDDALGDSWDTAFANIQTAIDFASTISSDGSPIQVWVKEGTYGSSIKMANNVEIYGGFAGTEKKLSDRVFGKETLLKVNSNYVVSNSFPEKSPLTNTAKLDRFSITGAFNYAIHNSNASPHITNCKIYDNASYGIYCAGYEASPIFENCTITKNNVGIYNQSSANIKVINCTILNNGRDGISNYSHYGVAVINSTIINNGNAGFFSYSKDEKSIIVNSIIWGNGNKSINNIYEDSLIISNSVVEGGFEGGTNIITSDPMLGELANYGGAVETVLVAKGSSAIGQGSTGEDIPTTDARGMARVTSPTIGAFEASGTTYPTGVSLIVNKALSVGEESQFVVYADGSPSEYILYKNGIIYKRQPSNVFTITPSQSGRDEYHAVVTFSGQYLESKIETVHYLSGNIIYVSPTGSDENAGDSWNAPLANLQYSIDLAASMATDENVAQVWLQSGRYEISAVNMRNNVEIYGGFAGTEKTLQERVSGNETTLYGERYVIHNRHTDMLNASAKLDSVTISGASYGIHGYFASPTIANCVIRVSGIGVYSNHSSPLIKNCTFNKTSTGIRDYYSESIIDNCVITESQMYGVYADFLSSPTIKNSKITNNPRGIFLSNSDNSVTVENTLISQNQYGVYSFSSASSVTLKNCTISENTSYAFSTSASITLTNCTIANNNGYVFSYYSNKETTLTNCTIIANRGLMTTSSLSNFKIKNCIINDNGSYYYGSYYSPMMRCSIFNNYYYDENGYQSYCYVIPRLGELGDYGGNVPTVPVLNDISTAYPAMTGEDIPETDARGVARATPCTIGAYEFSPFYDWGRANGLTGDDATPEAIPFDDGITNLEKYAFGLDASKATSYAESKNFNQTNDGTTAIFKFPVNKYVAFGSKEKSSSAKATAKILSSEDLINWTETSAISDGTSGDLNLYKVEMPIPEGGKLFFKVEVSN